MRKKSGTPKQSQSQAIPSEQPLGAPPKVVEVRERTPRKLKPCAPGYKPKRDDMHISLVRDDGDRISEMKALGFQMAKESDIEGHYPGRKEGTVIRRGKDLVAMIAPREEVEAREAKRLLENWARDRQVAKASDEEIKAHAVSLDDNFQEQEAIQQHKQSGGKSYFVMPGLPSKD